MRKRSHAAPHGASQISPPSSASPLPAARTVTPLQRRPAAETSRDRNTPEGPRPGGSGLRLRPERNPEPRSPQRPSNPGERQEIPRSCAYCAFFGLKTLASHLVLEANLQNVVGCLRHRALV
jgi:hypothetical protein